MSLLRRSPRARGMPPFRAGVLALVVIAIACWFAFGGRAPWERDHLVKAVLKSGNELGSRSPVRIAGVEVGKVKKIERGPGATAIVTMAIEKHGLPLHRDATLKVRPRLFLEGNFFIDLRPGTPSAPILPEGGTIPLSQTATPVQLDQVLTSLKAGTRDNLKLFLKGLSEAVSDGGARDFNRVVPLMEPALLETAVATEALRGQRPGDVSGLVADGERTARALASRRDRLPRLVAALDTTLTTLAERRANVGRSLAGLERLAREAPATWMALNRLYPTLRASAVEARPALRAAPPTLALANPLLVQARALLARRELPALLRDLDPAVRTLAVLSPRLRRAFAKLLPNTECLRRNAIPTLVSSVVDPPLTTGRPIYRELLDSLVGLASASQNFTGDGPAVRYHAGFGDRMITTGRVPSAGEPLVGLTSEPLIGSRPRFTAQPPPLRPDARCMDQRPPDLTAETGPAPEQGSAP